MAYVLTGFTHDMGTRIFAFDCVGPGLVRTQYKVSADLALTRRYGITVQELPLLCRGVLERRNESEEQRTFTYTEAEMSLHSSAKQDAASQKKRAGRRPTGEKVTGWRDPLRQFKISNDAD